MDFHGINTVGKIWLERLNSKPVASEDWVGRVIFALDTQTLSIGVLLSSGPDVWGWIDIASATQGGISNPSVPVGGAILFYSNTIMSGYKLHDVLITDDVVYINPLGVGGTAYAGGTWTLPDHDHPFSFSGGSHNHKWFTYGGAGDADSSYDAAGNHSYLARNNNHGPAQAKLVTAADDDLNGTKDFWTNKTSVAGSGTTNNNNAYAAWRPKGRNFTLQEKI